MNDVAPEIRMEMASASVGLSAVLTPQVFGSFWIPVALIGFGLTGNFASVHWIAPISAPPPQGAHSPRSLQRAVLGRRRARLQRSAELPRTSMHVEVLRRPLSDPSQTRRTLRPSSPATTSSAQCSAPVRSVTHGRS